MIHIKYHEKFSCSICAKVYVGTYLANHLKQVHNLDEDDVKKHMDEKQKVSEGHRMSSLEKYSCSICKHLFRPRQMKLHLEKDHELSEQDISKHMEEIRNKYNDKPFKCDICPKSFYRFLDT